VESWIKNPIVAKARDFFRRHWRRALRWREKIVPQEEVVHLVLASIVGVLGGLVNVFFYYAGEMVQRIFLAQPGDPAAFARSMDRLAGLAPLAAAALGRAGRTRVRELFETDRVVDQWEQLYANLLETRTIHVGSASRIDSLALETAVRGADAT